MWVARSVPGTTSRNFSTTRTTLDRSYAQLRREAQRFNATEWVPGHLTEAAPSQTIPSTPPTSPSLTECSRGDSRRQILSPHAMELTQHDDRVTLYYSEWTALRTVYTDGRALPESPEPRLLGYSVGHYEGDTLVVETIGVAADHSNAGFVHSDRAHRRSNVFTRSPDGSRLDVEVTFSDPADVRQSAGHGARLGLGAR